MPSPVAAAAEAAALPADDVLARLGTRNARPAEGRSGAAAAGGGPERVRSHRVHVLSVLAGQLRSPLLMLLAMTVMAVVDQIEITG